MPYKAIIRTLDGKPAIFLGSGTGRHDNLEPSSIVTIQVGDDHKQIAAAAWDALPAWDGPNPFDQLETT